MSRGWQGCAVALALGAIAARAMADDAPAAVPDCETPGIVQPLPANDHAVNNYPLLSATLGEHGTTYLDFVVDADGSVSDVHLAKSSGSMRLDDAAVDDVKTRWRYHPAQQNGKPIACHWKAEVRWELHHAFGPGSPNGPGVVIRMKPEDYPPGARERGEQGAVAMILVYAADGKLQMVQVVQSSGYPDLDVTSTALASTRVHAGNASYDGTPVKSVVLLVMVWGP